MNTNVILPHKWMRTQINMPSEVKDKQLGCGRIVTPVPPQAGELRLHSGQATPYSVMECVS